jgi:hypothetical protein
MLMLHVIVLLLILHTHIVMFLEFFFDSHGCVYFDPKQLHVL